MLLIACLILILASVISGEQVLVDLSQDLQTSASLNESPGAAAVNEVSAADPLIRASLVMEHGKIVSEYIREDVNPEEPFPVWSTTKSFISLLIGFMIQDNVLSLNDTLGQVFTSDDAWTNVTEVEFRQNVTIWEMLTMSSGLVLPPIDFENPPDYLFDVSDGGTAGGSALPDSLNFPDVDEKGVFSYLGVSNIMSYVISERTGMSPREYLAAKVLPALGIQDSDIIWWKNSDGIEYAYHGLGLTSHQMAKFGQLYLQKGYSKPDAPLISSDWVDDSLTPHLSFTTEQLPGVFITAAYGYLFWSGEDYQNNWCAVGAGGQDICINLDLGRVAVQQRDPTLNPLNPANLIIAQVALDPELSFSVKEDPTTTSSASPRTMTMRVLVGTIAVATTLIELFH